MDEEPIPVNADSISSKLLQDYCASLPLYAPTTLDDRYILFRFITSQESIDLFCVECNQPSVFIARKEEVEGGYNRLYFQDRVFTRELCCSRNSSHLAYFHFRIQNRVLVKTGQSPSMADLSESELRQYSKVLPPEEYRELTRAVGLATHGVGIGSFVYLRRIFERLIEEAHIKAISSKDWNDEPYQKARMDEKIEILEHYLPPFLVEQRRLYSILSKGIHSLSEKECLEAFPVVRVGIELILDQKIAAKQQKEKMEQANKRLAQLQQKIAGA